MKERLIVGFVVKIKIVGLNIKSEEITND